MVITIEIEKKILRFFKKRNFKTRTVDYMKRLAVIISGSTGNAARNFMTLKFKSLSPLSIFEVSLGSVLGRKSTFKLISLLTIGDKSLVHNF
jgi:hypothetical protein